MTLSPNGASPASNPNYGTPVPIIEAARTLLGGIDLDPASSAKCNARVDAFGWCGLDHPLPAGRDGLAVDWHGRIFLNPPGSHTKEFWAKLTHEWLADRVSAAVFVAFSIDFLQTSQVPPRKHVGSWLSALQFPVFVPAARIRYLHHETGEPERRPPKPSAIVWLPPTQEREEFASSMAGAHLQRAALRGRMSQAFAAQGVAGRVVLP